MTTEPNQTLQRPRVLGICCTFNRRELSLRALHSLRLAADCANVDLRMVFVDDASNDGTAEALEAAASGDVVVIRTSGDHYWAGAMRLGMDRALKRVSEFDYVLLFNDDIHAHEDALATLMADSDLRTDQVVVGHCVSSSGRRTYGGLQAIGRWRLLTFVPVAPGETCTAFNANLVLVGRDAFRALGPFPAPYCHNLADYDYGLRAAQMGIVARVSSRAVATCEINLATAPWLTESVGFRAAWCQILSPKGIPVRPWVYYCHKHGSILAPLYALAPYMKLMAHQVRRTVGKHLSVLG